MIVYSTPERRQKRMKDSAKVAPAPPVPVPLNLVSAAWDSENLYVDLVFERAINIDRVLVYQVQVDDGSITHLIYQGAGAVSRVDDVTVRLNLVQVGESTGSTVLLNAADDTNIIAQDDGTPWLGVSNYPVG